MFEDYFNDCIESVPLYTTKTKSTNETYKGISKVDHTKWGGWRIIKSEKMKGVHITEIDNKKLDTLVYNFYYTKYLEEKF